MRVIERYSRGMRVFLGRGAWSLLGPVRFALASLYGAHARIHSSDKAPSPSSGPAVISVGNIEAGGGGKTPCVLSLADALKEKGKRPAVISSGYGGDLSGQPAVFLPGSGIDSCEIPHGCLLWEGNDEETARALGDEAVLYVRAGVPLAVDRDRARGIRTISSAAEVTHILLDDAFHVRSVPKSLDILLLDWSKPFGDGKLLPYGTLREPADAVRRAGAVIFTRAGAGEVPDEAEGLLEDIPVFFSRHLPRALVGRGGESVEPERISGRETVLFSGIARPRSFEESAVEYGLAPAVSYRYDDHHKYTPADVREMTGGAGGDAVFVTTGKDWAKAAHLFPEATTLLRLDVEMEIEGIDRLITLSERIQ